MSTRRLRTVKRALIAFFSARSETALRAALDWPSSFSSQTAAAQETVAAPIT